MELAHPPSPQEVKSAFRKLALLHHPDRNQDNPTASALFREAAEAYNHLIGHPEEWLPRPEGSQAQAPDETFPQIIDVADIFDDIFGFTREGRVLGFQQPQEITLTLIEMAHGVVRRGKFSAFEKCSSCEGTGSGNKNPATICTYCFGQGQIRQSQGNENILKLCPRCEGRGRLIKKECAMCRGFGRTPVTRLQEAKIPPGFKPSGLYTIKSRDLKSEKKYDLFVRVRPARMDGIGVEMSDIVCEYPLSEKVAHDGGEIKFPWLWGEVVVSFPKGTPPDLIRVVPGHGLPSEPSGTKRGDLKIIFRRQSDRRAKRALKIFRKNIASILKPYTGGWWEDFF